MLRREMGSKRLGSSTHLVLYIYIKLKLPISFKFLALSCRKRCVISVPRYMTPYGSHLDNIIEMFDENTLFTFLPTFPFVCIDLHLILHNSPSLL